MDVEKAEQLKEAERIAKGLIALLEILVEDGRYEIPYPLFALFEIGLEKICDLAETGGGNE